MEENQSYSTVVDRNSEWPNLNALIARGALPTNYYANTHPSIQQPQKPSLRWAPLYPFDRIIPPVFGG
jgi:hypothetical protein